MRIALGELQSTIEKYDRDKQNNKMATVSSHLSIIKKNNNNYFECQCIKLTNQKA